MKWSIIFKSTDGRFVEGLNNKIKVIQRRCYGLKNIGHLSNIFIWTFMDIL
ncbi:MAG: transposase [Candidatus Competibacteraceae bacterium]|nr:transposase [Candidatus Competibacteraceae bacterium]